MYCFEFHNIRGTHKTVEQENKLYLSCSFKSPVSMKNSNFAIVQCKLMFNLLVNQFAL